MERAVLVGVGGTGGRGSLWTAQDSLDELGELVRSAGAEVVATIHQPLDQPHPVTYVGKGKLEEVGWALEEHEATLAVFDDELTPTQQRNLERILKTKVIDRTALILDIFASRARTHEGRLQVALAQAEYLLPRLAGQWSHLERLGGGIGTRGPGETQIETDRRLVRNRISRLRHEIAEVRQHRKLLRTRRSRGSLPLCALVGYTNAGKSTILRKLTGADVLAADQLFATLDPTVRRLDLSGGLATLLSDTVGFIHKLPTQLVAAFRATLEELEDADLLVHVVDLSHRNRLEQAITVDRILAEIGLQDRPSILVLNKADRFANAADRQRAIKELRVAAAGTVDQVVVSALTGEGMDDLPRVIERALRSQRRVVDVLIPWDRGDVRQRIHERGSVLKEEHLAEGSLIRAEVPVRLAGFLEPWLTRPGTLRPVPNGAGA